MTHFAEIDENSTVLRILVIPDEQEYRGQDFLANDMQLGGNWVRCSYNNRIRKQYPGIGYKYDETGDVFINPKPYPSWSLDGKYDWQPPKPYPNDGEEYTWDEQILDWILVTV